MTPTSPPATTAHGPRAVPSNSVTVSSDGRSIRWEAHREERRRELIKAARRAIHRLGPDASMEDIAVDAGTSKSVFYRYFGDKSGLRQAVGTVVIRQMQERITAARKGAAAPREGVTAMVTAYLQMAQTSPQVYFFVTTLSDGDTRQSGELSGFFDSVTAMITEPIKNLLGDLDSPLVGYWPTAALGLVRTAGELWLQTPDTSSKPDSTVMATQITAWLFDGVERHVPATARTISLSAAEGRS